MSYYYYYEQTMRTMFNSLCITNYQSYRPVSKITMSLWKCKNGNPERFGEKRTEDKCEVHDNSNMMITHMFVCAVAWLPSQHLGHANPHLGSKGTLKRLEAAAQTHSLTYITHFRAQIWVLIVSYHCIHSGPSSEQPHAPLLPLYIQ